MCKTAEGKRRSAATAMFGAAASAMSAVLGFRAASRPGAGAAAQPDQAREVLRRHCVLVGAVLAMPALPSGVLVPGLDATLASARALLAAPDATPRELWAACRALMRGSPIAGLARVAGGVTGGDPAAVATLLGTGWWLGSAAFQRWRAQVLGAPVSSAVLPFGTLSAGQMREALAASPAMRAALEAAGVAAPEAALAAIVLCDDAEPRLWAQFGPEAPWAVFLDRQAVGACLDECLRAVLAGFVAQDVTDAAVARVTGLLDGAADPALRPRARLSAAGVARLSAGVAAAPGAAAQAAFHALVVLTERARTEKVHLPLALSEVLA